MNMFSGITARRLYICTSTRNLAAYRRLQQALELSRYEVLDWTRFLPAPGRALTSAKTRTCTALPLPFAAAPWAVRI